MTALASPRVYRVLAGVQAADAVACAIPLPPIKKSLDELGVPENIRWVFPLVKGLAAVGLVSVARFPGLARLTTLMLTVYFVLAVGAHVRVHDKPVNAVPAAGFLALFAAMTATGPAQT